MPPIEAPKKSTRWVWYVVGGALLFFLGMVAVAVVLVAGYVRSNTLPSEAEMPQIMREAAGSAPIPADDTPARKAVRDAYVLLLQERKQYSDAAAQHTGSAEFANLMQDASFVEVKQRDGALKELRALREIDARHVAAVERFPEMMRQNLAAAGVAGDVQEAFDRGLRRSWGPAMAKIHDSVDTEMAWLDAAISLYEFAQENGRTIGLGEDGRLVISDDAVRSRFNEMLSKSEELRKQAVDATEQFEKDQQGQRQKFGLTEQDLAH